MPDPAPQTMLCGTCVRPGDFRLEARPRPEQAPEGWVLVDIAAVGLCGTDYHIFEGNQPFLAYPRVIGHELSGAVVADAAGWRAGARVVINPYLSCGTCRACLRGAPNCCMRIEVLGVHRDGGLCARIALPPGNLYPADGLTLREAAMVEFLAIGAHAVRRGAVGPQDRVLVTGIGPIGVGAALFARLAGAEVHVSDASPVRLASVRDVFGFEAHAPGPELLAGDRADGFDVVFDATGSRAAIEAGFANVAHAGRYVLVSVIKGEVTFIDAEFHKRETTLLGSRNAVRADFEAVMAALRERTIDSAALCSEVLSLEELPGRLPGLAKDREGLIKAIVALTPEAAA